MGFWTDKNKKPEQQHHYQEGIEFDNNLFSNGIDSFRECCRDPSNEDYLFCKDVRQSLDKNGKLAREEGEEQRVSMDELLSNPLGSTVKPVNIFKTIFEGINQFIQPEKLDKEIQQIFQKFKSEFFNTQQQQPTLNDQQQNCYPHTSFSSFSSSSSHKCKYDQNDNNFLICTTTITRRTSDGQQTIDEKEERIPVQGSRNNQLSNKYEGFPSSLFGLRVPFFPSGSTFTPTQNETTKDQLLQQDQLFNQGNLNQHGKSNARENDYKYPDFQKNTKKRSTEIHDL